MIKLHVGEPGGLYHYCMGVPFGPLTVDGRPMEDVLSFRHPNDYLHQGAELFGEKSVQHQKYEGDFYINPSIESARITTVTDSSWSYDRFTMRWYRVPDRRLLEPDFRDGFHVGAGGKVYYQGEYRWHWYEEVGLSRIVQRTLARSHWGFWIATEYEARLDAIKPDGVYYKGYTRISRSELVKYPQKYYPDHELKSHWENVFSSPDMDYSDSPTTWSSSRYTCDKYSSIFSPRLLKNYLLSQSLEIRNIDASYSSNTKSRYELVSKTLEDLDAINTNLIAFVKDLKDVKSLVPKLQNLRKLKTHASNHLAMQYGVLPTISDLKEIVGAFTKAAQYDRFGRKLGYSADTYTFSTKARSGETVKGSRTQRAKIAVRTQDSSLNTFLESLENVGFGLNFENIWDLIPYSFIVDWFVDVGDFLSDIDNRIRLARLPIEYITYSDKYESLFVYNRPPGFPAVYGQLKRVNYVRSVTTEVPLQDFKLSQGSGVTPHWLEAGALVVQRSKK